MITCITNRTREIFTSFAENIVLRRHMVDTLFSLVCINSFLAGMSFITTLLIANILGKELFGDYSYAIAVGGYCYTIAFCGLDRSLIRDLVHHPERFDEYTSASIILRGTMLVLGFLFILGINAMATQVNRLGFIGALIVFIQGVQALNLASMYDALDRMKRHAVFLLIERCFYFGSVWTFVWLFRDSLSIPVIAIFMLFSTFIGLTLQYSYSSFKLYFRINRNSMMLAIHLLKKNLWVWSAVLATLSFGGLSKIILKHISGSNELGDYSVAWQVVPLASIFITQIGRIGNPRLARVLQPATSRNKKIRFLLRYTILSTIAGTIIGMPAILFPGHILQIFRPEYATAAFPLRIFGGYVIIISLGQVATQYLIAVHKELIYSMVVILSGVLSLFLYHLFIPLWSATGAALAVFFSHGTAIIIYCVTMIYFVINDSNRKIDLSSPT